MWRNAPRRHVGLFLHSQPSVVVEAQKRAAAGNKHEGVQLEPAAADPTLSDAAQI